jgi:hypothetical protein
MITNVFDFNNLCVRHYFIKDVEAETDHPNLQLWRYRIIESVYNSLFKESDVNEILLAVDAKKSWRKLYWSRYKESREGKRDAAKIDWNLFHREYETLCDDIQENLPFKVLRVQTAEADDIIGVICLEKKEKEFVIISNDEDFLQLTSSRVRLYHPAKMTYVSVPDTEKFIVEKCLTGQAKDDIFNIKTPIDWPKDKRKPGFGPVSAEKVMKDGYEKWLEKEKLVERFHINRVLIDLKLIPNAVKSRVLGEYHNYKHPDPSLSYEFFKKNNFTGFLDNMHSVENNLMKLY